ncbi:MAG TPA: nucleotidyltransferase domain-containing protein [Ktedonobacteraceae bacterium]|nr:nucleotidyltransferase domain-containing protein [Ktedonobacteraceae bacterium]
MSETPKNSLNGIQEQQIVSLSDEFLHELVQELDHEDIVGITLGGSYARGTATRYSDVDLACFWREGLRPPPKRFMYRQGKLISIKMTSVAELHEMLKRPQAVILFVSGRRRVLLDKDGSVARLQEEIEVFRWEDLQSAANENVSLWMMLKAEDVQKVLREFQQENAAGLAFAISNLVAELTLLTALCFGTLITNNSTYYQQVQEAAGLDSAWTRYHRIATGLEAGPTDIVPLRAQGMAALHLYRETFAFARPVMQAAHVEIVEQVLQIVRSAVEQLPFTEEERRWLKNGI